MPGIPRISGRATKIAYKILGVPANMKFKRTKEQKKINQRLLFEETVRVR
jgi:hypothetical protein